MLYDHSQPSSNASFSRFLKEKARAPHTASPMVTILTLMSFLRQAHRIAKSPAVKAALSQAEEGNFGSLTICAVEAELLALKKISNDPTVAAYVRLEALRAIMEHRRANPESEPEPPKKQSTIEELERMLRTQCGQKPGVANRANGFDADLDDPDFTLD
jgi:hypothetical protein